ncbi:hypothetical protein GCM10010402_61000 [Actinomadura luteofluorescens]
MRPAASAALRMTAVLLLAGPSFMPAAFRGVETLASGPGMTKAQTKTTDRGVFVCACRLTGG